MSLRPNTVIPARDSPAQCINYIRAKVRFDTPGILSTNGAWIGTLPTGAVLLGSYAKVVTAFNGTTPALTVGTDLGVAANILGAADITEGTPGAYGPIAAGSALTITAPTPIYAKLVAAGVSTGEAVIVIPFVPDDDG